MISGSKEKVTRTLQGRAVAYNRVFAKENQFTNEVLKDLAKFCRAHKTCFHADPRVHAAMEGRREVFLRIVEHLNLSYEELFRLYPIKET